MRLVILEAESLGKDMDLSGFSPFWRSDSI